jgi:hypothetical protein
MGLLLEPSGYFMSQMRERGRGILRSFFLFTHPHVKRPQEGAVHWVPFYLEAEQEAEIVLEGGEAFFLARFYCILIGEPAIKIRLFRSILIHDGRAGMMIRGMICVLCVAALALGQNAQSYKSTGDSLKGGLLDPSRFSLHHSLSMGMASSTGSSLQSQGLYSTMLTYKFSQPLTLNLNFGFPLFSTFSPGQNLSAQNLKSADYFKNMPLEASLSWKPTDNMYFQLSFIRAPGNYYYDSYYSPFFYLPVNRGAAMAADSARTGR